ncbi:DUF6531 domain-containing protein [Xanthomonas sp. AM6]|uniref:RHS repeat-associated core domain-containing protein n=1 Tax=Xanthomonas sp. AM6 TaxID=2982531 RepID=UPI0021DA7000|nr:RHS repeat-associated core domain-containing protein [Xanthomonas sp. AM6]UYB53449.1 DUF6531 domain-containing protein [Xanthomonas sp. AM6]
MTLLKSALALLLVVLAACGVAPASAQDYSRCVYPGGNGDDANSTWCPDAAMAASQATVLANAVLPYFDELAIRYKGELNKVCPPMHFSGELSDSVVAYVKRISGNCNIPDDGKGVWAAWRNYPKKSQANLGAACCKLRAGNPINFGTGNKYLVDHDFSTASGLQLDRHYNSYESLGRISLGLGWHLSYDRSVEPVGDSLTAVIVTRQDGKRLKFKKTNDLWTPEVGISDALVEKLDSTGERAGFVFKPSDGFSSEFYGSSGALERIEWNDGRRVFLQYSDASTPVAIAPATGYLIGVVDGNGRSLGLAYSENRLARVSLPDGGELQYQYDTSKRLVGVMYADGATKAYTYNEQSYTSGSPLTAALTGVVDERGDRYATYVYEKSGRAISTFHGPGYEKVDVEYSGDTSATVHYPTGLSTTFQFAFPAGIVRFEAGSGFCIGCGNEFKSETYDANGFPDQLVGQDGLTVDRDYNARGLLVQQIEADATSSKRSVQTDWHASMRLPVARRSYDASSALVASSSWTYNARGQTLTSTRVDPAASVARATTTTYCEQQDIDAARCPMLGLITSINGARTDLSDVSIFAYYASDDTNCVTSFAACPHRKGDLWKVTNALGQVTEYLSYDGAGRVLSVKDANGLITDFTYHARGWLTASKVRGADDTSESDDRITLIDYWPTGLVKQVTQPDGAFTAFTYDAAHRLTDITDNAGNTLHYTLDNAGNRIKEDTKDASGALKRTLSRVYNQLGQLATQATAGGDPTDFGYDANGNTETVTDALGHVTQNDYDPLNRLARTLQDVGGINAETKFSYDALDNLTKVTDPKGLDTTYTYNGLGDLTKLTSPDTGVTTYTYDSAGNRATQIDARNVKTTYSYDALNRLTKVAYPTTSLNVTYTYDVSPTVCASGETYAVGRLARMQDTTGTTEYCYDRFGDLVRKVQTTNGKVFVLRYAYTKAGQLSRLTYPDGAAVDYVRNAQGQTTEVAVTPAGGTRQVLLSNATYYPFGPVASWSYGNGRPMQRVLDQDYRPLAVSDTRTDGLSTGFAFDPAGNLSALTAAGNTAPVVSLDYDALGRLTAFKDGPTGTVIDGYSYDATGNRLSAKVNTTTQTYTYPTSSHRLDAVAGAVRTYDAIGNTLSIGGTAQEFVYDANGRMGQAKRAGTVVMKYSYNGRGEQVRRVGKTNTYTLYDESGHWLGDYDINGAALQQAIWLDDLPVGVLAKNSLRYVQPDHLGTPRAVIDPVRDVAIWKWDLKGEAFGNTPPDQDPDKDGIAFVFDMRFPGQRYDAATGLNQNYFRDYEPGIGRYGQSDLVGLSGGISTYSYVFSRPFEMHDVSGLVAVPMSIPGIPPPHPLVWAALAGFAIGEGFNYGYEYLSGGSPGTDLYDWTHPQYSQPFDESSGIADIPASRAVPVPYPDRFRGGFSCICRANRDGRSADNCSNDNQQSAMGYGQGATLSEAKKMAEKNAKDNLGAKSTHHVQCRCTGPKGDRIIPHG